MRERERGGWAGQQAVLLKVRFGRDGGERQRDIETKRHRDRADNKNPEQSRVVQLVLNVLIWFICLLLSFG